MHRTLWNKNPGNEWNQVSLENGTSKMKSFMEWKAYEESLWEERNLNARYKSMSFRHYGPKRRGVGITQHISPR